MKRILCIFFGKEGTSSLDYFLGKINTIYKPRYEPIDLCHYDKIEYNELNNNMIEYMKFLFNIKNNIEKINLSRLKSLKNISLEQYNKIVSKYNYIYYKARYNHDMYKLEQLKLDYIILPIRYDFEFILSLYIKRNYKDLQKSLSQFNRSKINIKDEKKLYQKRKLNKENFIYELTTIFDRYINLFKTRYNFLKKNNYNIFIYNYNEFKENNILVLNKLLKFLDIPNENISYDTYYKKKIFSYSIIFDNDDNKIIKELKKKYFDEKYNNFDKFIKSIQNNNGIEK